MRRTSEAERTTGSLNWGLARTNSSSWGQVALEGLFPEELEGADDLGGGLAGDLLVRLEMDAILAEFLGGDQVGRAVIMLAELTDTGQVGLFGAGAEGQELQVIGEGF